MKLETFKIFKMSTSIYMKGKIFFENFNATYSVETGYSKFEIKLYFIIL